MTYSNCYYP